MVCKTECSTLAEEHAEYPNPWTQSCTLKQGCACTHSWPDPLYNVSLTVLAEQVEHGCPDPGASGAPPFVRTRHDAHAMSIDQC
jgi:hypothetical protein